VGRNKEIVMISIGAVYRGPELKGSEINRLIMAINKALKEFRGQLKLGEVPWVNAVFVVSGSLGAADFEGLKYGDYSKKDKGVVVQIAIPTKIVEGEGLVDFLVDSLHGANAMAFEFFRQKGEEFPLREAEGLVSSVAKKFQ
jgi:hypothetical protein